MQVNVISTKDKLQEDGPTTEDSDSHDEETQKDDSATAVFPYTSTPFSSAFLHKTSKPILKSLTKRERATWQQKVVLEKIFSTNQYPDAAIRNELSQQLGMSPRKVQIWFQNRRTKERKKDGPPTPPIPGIPPSLQNVKFGEHNHDKWKEELLRNGPSLLFLSASAGHPTVRRLLDNGIPCNVANQKGQTPLWIAVFNGHEETVNTLLDPKYNCDVNIADNVHGQTPLHVAVLKGQELIVRLLLTKAEKINVNARDKMGCTPLHHACISGHLELATLLLEHKADPNARSEEGYTPLHASSLIGNLSTVKILLDYKAVLDATDNQGFTALAFATREGHEEIVGYLLAAEASIDLKTKEGFTALLISCCKENIKILKLLIDSGACITEQTLHRINALHLASMHGRVNNVKFLLDIGFDPSLRDEFGKTALDLAIEFHHSDVARLLVEQQH